MLNKKILLSVLMIGTIAVMAGAGTWASFTDTGKSTANTFTAGTLDLKFGTAETMTGFNIENVAPNAQGTAGTISITNSGTIPATLTGTASNIVNNENGMNAPETAADTTNGVGDLGSAVTITISDGSSTPIYSGLVSGLSGANFGAFTAGQTKTYTVTYSVSNAGNEIQSDILSFDIDFTLTQA